MLKLINNLKLFVKRIVCAILLISTTHSYAEVVHHYDPELLTITGIIVDMTFPGPPDYVEGKNDESITIPIVLLNNPIDVFPMPNIESNDPDNQAEKNVQFMQLFSDDKPVKIRGCAKLTGSLIHQITAHHYTRVLMNVRQIEKINTCHLLSNEKIFNNPSNSAPHQYATEVAWAMLSFIAGDPNQPLITGRLHQANNRPPHALPEHSTRTVICTETVRGKGFSELYVEDAAQREKISIHARKDMATCVKRALNQTGKIKGFFDNFPDAILNFEIPQFAEKVEK